MSKLLELQQSHTCPGCERENLALNQIGAVNCMYCVNDEPIMSKDNPTAEEFYRKQLEEKGEVKKEHIGFLVSDSKTMTNFAEQYHKYASTQPKRMSDEEIEKMAEQFKPEVNKKLINIWILGAKAYRDLPSSQEGCNPNTQAALVSFMDDLREYLLESHADLNYDERDSLEFVEIFLNKHPEYKPKP